MRRYRNLYVVELNPKVFDWERRFFEDQAMSRAELSNLFQKGMLFLKAILDSIEETKLRMP
jgi:hypothetical protein